MKRLLFDLFLVALGAGLGVFTIYLLQAGSKFDKDKEFFERSKNK